jgi:hypothetical protein
MRPANAGTPPPEPIDGSKAGPAGVVRICSLDVQGLGDLLHRLDA